MSDHPGLAKGKISNCPEGRASSNRLWEQLTTKLNGAGPPVKNVTLWRKVYADQKQQVKKKLSFNKASKNQTGGGPYEEELLTQSEELILEAAGLSAAVEGLSSVQSFGAKKGMEVDRKENDEEELMDVENDMDCSIGSTVPSSTQRRTKSASKMDLLKENIEKHDEGMRERKLFWDTLMDCKRKSLKIKEETYKLKERSLKIKEEEHKSNMAINKVELEIKTLELNLLKQKADL
ncbi:uncharacterized protein LOC133322017 [Musca vetustissima]|uniref:uncharacterized protein LOC133322017 n=1 Tax=Musca vetustissima TaxID=27455 RepID=UPI002AB79970|nr:uncharacterized protein LOC133322017 [Musca vetustissima]